MFFPWTYCIYSCIYWSTNVSIYWSTNASIYWSTDVSIYWSTNANSMQKMPKTNTVHYCTVASEMHNNGGHAFPVILMQTASKPQPRQFYFEIVVKHVWNMPGELQKWLKVIFFDFCITDCLIFKFIKFLVGSSQKFLICCHKYYCWDGG